MEAEHESVGDGMAAISRLIDNFTPSEQVCTTYRVPFARLNEFEANLHRHVHQENNILFPAAIAVEKELLNDSEQEN